MTTVENVQAGEATPLGQRLRDRRRALGLTLKDVAEGADLTAGFISQVERGLTAPSLSSLVAISKVLGTHMTQFLSQPSGKSPLTRHNQRLVYSLADNDVSYERISASFAGSRLNSVVFHEPPGHRSEPIRHEGEELFFILDGELTVEVEGGRTFLAAGDSIHFDSQRRHSTWNHTTEPTTVLHVCTMDVFGDGGQAADAPGSRAGHDIPQGTEPGSEKIYDPQSGGTKDDT